MTIRFSDITGGGIPYGDTDGRPASPATGKLYSNGEAARLELYTETGWQNIVQETPGVASISGVYLESENSGTITISGTNFTPGCYATAVGSNGVQVDAASTTFNSIVQVTATFSNLSNAYEPYDIKVTNPSNLFGIIPDALYINASPVWTTSAGSLGTFNELVSVSVSATATDSDSTITYSLANGSSLPPGLSLNSSTGLISGTLPEIVSNTTYTFTINASDGANTIVPRTFSITATNISVPAEYLILAGGGGGGTDQGGGGGAGGLISSSSALTIGTPYTIVVGSGGAANGSAQRGSSGGNSTAFGLTAIGGGGGGGLNDVNSRDGASGGSGGGGAARWDRTGNGIGGNGTSGQGNSGGRGSNLSTSSGGGGGGGAGAAGQQGQDSTSGNGGNGGSGLASSITGTSTFYGGGGGGGVYGNGGTSMSPGIGGSSIGGRGLGPGATTPSDYTIHNGVANTGSGGGGGFGSSAVLGGNGSAGVVIVAYPDTYPAATVTGSYTQPTRSGYRVYRFIGNGTITF